MTENTSHIESTSSDSNNEKIPEKKRAMTNFDLLTTKYT
jgi:hypothetical protein